MSAGSPFSPDYQAGASVTSINNGRHEEPLVMVVGFGNAATFPMYTELLGRLLTRPVHVIAMTLPDGATDVDLIAKERAAEITSIANGRPVAFIGNSAGADLNVAVAHAMKPAQVVGLWNDAMYSARQESFAITALKGIKEFVRGVPNPAEAIGTFSYYGANPVGRLATSRFCQRLRMNDLVGDLNDRGIPMMFSHGQRDTLVLRADVEEQIRQCRDTSLVASIELPSGHGAMARFSPAIQLMTERWVDVCGDLVRAPRPQRAKLFGQFETSLIAEAEMNCVNLREFEPSLPATPAASTLAFTVANALSR